MNHRRSVESTPFWKTFDHNRGRAVPEEWQTELYNYVVCGYPPGSFHTAVFANDLYGAASRSHPLNTWEAISAMCLWLMNVAPHQCYGSREKVDAWVKMDNTARRQLLEGRGLLLTNEEVVWKVLNDKTIPAL